MKYSVCIDSVLGQKTPLEALKCVKQAGLKYYEFWAWWTKNVDELLSAQQSTGIQPVAFCTRMISLTDASAREKYLQGLQETIVVCKKLNCTRIISQVGAELEGVSRKEQHQSIVDGLTACTKLLEEEKLTLLIEPLNTKIDHPGYYLSSSCEAFEIIDEVNSPNVKLLFDLYHQHITEGLDTAFILNHLPRIGHFHIAGYPGRHEPLEPNEIDYQSILKAIQGAGFQDATGLEYFPVGDALTGLTQWNEFVQSI